LLIYSPFKIILRSTGQLVPKSVHSFSKYRVHKFDDEQTDGRTNERTDRHVKSSGHVFASFCVHWGIICQNRSSVQIDELSMDHGQVTSHTHARFDVHES